MSITTPTLSSAPAMTARKNSLRLSHNNRRVTIIRSRAATASGTVFTSTDTALMSDAPLSL
jgi:hypothetical protein